MTKPKALPRDEAFRLLQAAFKTFAVEVAGHVRNPGSEVDPLPLSLSVEALVEALIEVKRADR